MRKALLTLCVMALRIAIMFPLCMLPIGGCKKQPIPMAAIGAMSLSDMKEGDHAYCSPEVMSVDKERIGWLSLKDEARLTPEQWIKEKKDYLEIFKSDEGWYVIQHGYSHTWSLVKHCSTLNKDAVALFTRTEQQQPLFQHELPEPILKKHQQHAFNGIPIQPQEQIAKIKE